MRTSNRWRVSEPIATEGAFAPRRLLVTGGAGFIGSHLVHAILGRLGGPTLERLVVLDRLTYAGHLENLAGLETDSRFVFVRGDIVERDAVERSFAEHVFDSVVHLAAESHVDRSIHASEAFIRTNVRGSQVLFDVAARHWKDAAQPRRFVHVSTDEVFGSAPAGGRFDESSAYAPSSPYSASKASADLFALAAHRTHGLPVVITHSSNNYGPRQLPEKLVPLVVRNAARTAALPVYGDGLHARDWLHVDDHVSALWVALERGIPGERYVFGTGETRGNLDLVTQIADEVDRHLGRAVGTARAHVRFVADRPGHDRRCCVDASKARRELGWWPRTKLDAGLRHTVEWYLSSEPWLDAVIGHEYRSFYRLHYGEECP